MEGSYEWSRVPLLGAMVLTYPGYLDGDQRPLGTLRHMAGAFYG